MRLRDHPKMKFLGQPNWPPTTWAGSYGPGTEFLTGEEGVLRDAIKLDPGHKDPKRLRLVVEYKGRFHSTILCCDDHTFIEPLCEKLQRCRGLTIREIGDLEVDF